MPIPQGVQSVCGLRRVEREKREQEYEARLQEEIQAPQTAKAQAVLEPNRKTDAVFGVMDANGDYDQSFVAIFELGSVLFSVFWFQLIPRYDVFRPLWELWGDLFILRLMTYVGLLLSFHCCFFLGIAFGSVFLPDRDVTWVFIVSLMCGVGGLVLHYLALFTTGWWPIIAMIVWGLTLS